MSLTLPIPRRLRAVVLPLSLALLAACSRHEAPAEASAPMPPPAAPMASLAAGGAAMRKVAEPMAEAARAADAAAPQQQRHLAVRHDLRVELPAERLTDAWTQVRDQCGQLRCELLSSSLRRESPRQPGGASLELRVAPQDVDRLLGTLAGVARVVSHDTVSEDKTAEVIDVEAHIRNRTQFRDSLRAMLADRTTRRDLSDLLEIQRTLADTQAELDSRATQLKALMQLTQMQRVQIEFVPEASLASRGGANPIARAWREAGEVLAGSAGALITFAAAALPWLLAAVPLLWIARRLWRRRRARKIGA